MKMNKTVEEIINQNPYLDSEAVQKYLAITYYRTMIILKDERLKVIKLGNTYRVRLADLNEYIENYLYSANTNKNNNEAKNTKTRKRRRTA